MNYKYMQSHAWIPHMLGKLYIFRHQRIHTVFVCIQYPKEVQGYSTMCSKVLGIAGKLYS